MKKNKLQMKKTKIVCTIGPKTETKEVLASLLDAGMNVIRLNFSHGDYKEHGSRIASFRSVMRDSNRHAAILLDTKGPEIRTMSLKGHEDFYLTAGQVFTFTTDKSFIGDNKGVAVTYSGFASNLKTGNTVLVDDGLISMKVLEVKGNSVVCRVMNSGDLGENKGVNLPGVDVELPALSEKDKNDLIFGCENKVDFVAASFVRKKSDVIEIRSHLEKHGGHNIQIISKIENQEGINNFDEILEESDGIMVARGDLGVEIPVEEVIFAQKNMIKKCNYASKFVITATQMLDSMIKNPRPTRAEAGDVANAILDGTDAVMLSGESAKGKYPVEAVKIMSAICKKTDEVMQNMSENNEGLLRKKSVYRGIVEIAKNLSSPLIVIATEDGKSAKLIRKYCPEAMILALTSNESVSHHLIMSKGIETSLVNPTALSEDFHKISKRIAIEGGYAKKGEAIVMVSRDMKGDCAINTTCI
jgi:pyruvate kinase